MHYLCLGNLAVRRGFCGEDSSGCYWFHGSVAGQGDVFVGPDRVLVEVTFEDVQVLTEVTDFGPVALYVVEVAREVRKCSLIYF